MALKVGQQAPAWTMPGSDGEEWSDARLRGSPYVFTFYPQDETAGCVAQVCALRDVWEDFRHSGTVVFGVSRDSIESHKEFVSKRKLPYTLLTDASGQVHKAFDVGRNFLKVTNRVSYLVDKDGKIAAAYESNLRPEEHSARMLEAAKAL